MPPTHWEFVAERSRREAQPAIDRHTVIVGAPYNQDYRRHSGGRVISIEGEDKRELVGSGTLVRTRHTQGVLTCGHVVAHCRRVRGECRPPAYNLRVRMPREPSSGREQLLVVTLEDPFIVAIGEENRSTSGPDIAFIEVNSLIADDLARLFGDCFYPWQPSRVRMQLQRSTRRATEMGQLLVGFNHRLTTQLDQVSRVDLRELVTDCVRLDDSPDGWDRYRHTVQAPHLVPSRLRQTGVTAQAAELFERIPSEIAHYGGMSGGGVWSLLWDVGQLNTSFEPYLDGVTFAQWPTAPVEGHAERHLYRHGPRSVQRILDEVDRCWLMHTDHC